jgi:hypothetical protein
MLIRGSLDYIVVEHRQGRAALSLLAMSTHITL